MKEIYPDYADEVAFYAVGADPSESIERLYAYGEAQGYPWPMAYAEDGTLSNLRIFVQSSKLAFDRNGEIVYRDSYGGGGSEKWAQVFEDLASQ